MIKQNQRALNITGVIIDSLCIIFSMTMAWFIRFNIGSGYEGWYIGYQEYLRLGIIIIPVYLLLYYIFNLYKPQRISSVHKEFFNLVKSNIIGILTIILGLYILKQIHYSRKVLFMFFFINVLVTIFERGFIRYILRRMRRKGKNLKHVLLVGYSVQTVEFIDRIRKNKYWGYNVVGILDDMKYPKSSQKENPITNEIIEQAIEEAAAAIEVQSESNNFSRYSKLVIGKLKNLNSILNKCDIDEVFITLKTSEFDKLEKLINVCEKNGVRAQIIPDYYRYLPAKPYVEEVDGLPIINIRYVPLDNIMNKFFKRIFDILVSSVCLLLTSPVLIFTAVTIKITSPGPILFKQERVGLNKNNFNMYKFRSMHVQKDEDEKVEWTTKNDPRKTKFGSFIRKTSIDELPQFFNVLKGDMSIIGPRPERPYFVDKFKEEIPKYMIKHHVRPGITGWAQVSGFRGDTSIKKRIEHDIYYIENWTFGFDLKIFFMTFVSGFINKNAY